MLVYKNSERNSSHGSASTAARSASSGEIELFIAMKCIRVKPVWWLNKSLKRTSSGSPPSIGNSNHGKYFVMGALKSILPSSTSVPIAAEVKDFVTDPIANKVSAVTATSSSMFETPNECSSTVLSLSTTASAIPGMWYSTCLASSFSTRNASRSSSVAEF